ncbi:MAG TPA: glutaredoxin family protein [Terriglobales bacterium]|nr:glutaredoxin family protein [Terriglobales bacterium]
MFCQSTKEFLSKHGIQFDDRNIAADPGALDELRKMHVMTTPVTKIADAVIVGFDEEKLRNELEISG